MLKQNFEIIKGETFIRDILIKVNDEVYPLNNYTALSEIRPYVGSKTLIESFSCEIFPEEGMIRITLTNEQTNNLPFGILYYDLLLINQENNEHTYYLGGKIIVKKHVTEIPT